MLHLGNHLMLNTDSSEADLVYICRPTRTSLRVRVPREQVVEANPATDKVTDLYGHATCSLGFLWYDANTYMDDPVRYCHLTSTLQNTCCGFNICGPLFSVPYRHCHW